MPSRRLAAAWAALAVILAALSGCGSGGGTDPSLSSVIRPQRAFGVFVGISQYPLALPPLEGADQDAATMWESLSGTLPPWPRSPQTAAAQARLLTWPPLSASSTRLPDGALGAPSREAILQAISDFAALMTPADLFVLYFSGHADYDPAQGRAYLYSSGLHEDRISDAELAAALAAVPGNPRAANVVLIVDACQAGAFARLAAARPGLQVLASCAADEDSAISSGHSLFTSALVQGLGRDDLIGPADANGDRAITPRELFDHAAWATRQMSAGQHPTFGGAGALGEMALKYAPCAP